MTIGGVAASGLGVDRATKSVPGQVKVFSADIDQPQGIAAGPDGALWFTNPESDSIGRISTAGT